MERVSDFMLFYTGSIDLLKARELKIWHKVFKLQTHEEYMSLTIDIILDKIGKINTWAKSFDWNEKVILTEYQPSLLDRKE